MKRATLYLLLAGALAALLPETASSQWTRTQGPQGSGYISMAGDQTMIVGSIYPQGFMRYNMGSWEELSAPVFDRLHIARGIVVGNQAGPVSYRSTDYGGNWTRTNAPGYVNVLGDRFYSMREDTLFRSDDALDWTLVGKMPTPYSFPILSGDTLYVLRGLLRNALSRSTDGGANWSDVPSNLAELTGKYRKLAAGPGGLYLSDESSHVYRSTDGGANWSDLSAGIPDDVRIYWTMGSGDGEAFWAGSDREVYRLAGDRWVGIDMPSRWPYPVSMTDGLLVSTQIGPYKIPSDGGEPISLINGLARTVVTAIGAVDSVVVASTGEQMFRSTNDGASWDVVADLGLYSIVNDRRVLIGTGNGAHRSLDSGLTWEPLMSRLGGGTAFMAVATGDGETYLAEGLAEGTGVERTWLAGGIYRSTDRGESWTRLVQGLPARNGVTVPVFDVAIRGTRVFINTDDGIFRSIDHGATWTRSQQGLPDPSPSDPQPVLYPVEGRVYLKYGAVIYMSTDDAEHWTMLESYPGVGQQLGRGHVLNGRFYVHTYQNTDDGIIVRSYGHDGTRWNDESDSFPQMVGLTDIVEVGDRLFAGSNGYGVWRYDAPSTAGVEHEEAVSGGVAVAPNPTSGDAVARFVLSRPSDVVAELLDILGRPLSRLAEGMLQAGQQRIRIDVGGLAPGTYFLKLIIDGIARTERIVVQ